MRDPHAHHAAALLHPQPLGDGQRVVRRAGISNLFLFSPTGGILSQMSAQTGMSYKTRNDKNERTKESNPF
jgi:hypothetical protein